MEIEQELASITPQGETLLTIGVFDGVHAGHRYLLKQLQQQAAQKDLVSGVVTFDPHPQSVLHPHDQLPQLSSLEDRIATFQQLGINIVAVLAFTPELAQLGARDFMSLLKKYLKMRGIVVGPDFVLGRGGEGNIDLLHTLGDRMGFSVEVASPYTINGEVVSSTLIRQALIQGDMKRVEKLMGRRFYIRGNVITSDKRGRVLGFPTANLDIEPQQALPNNGIYATMTQVAGKRFPSATNIGSRPTFGEGKRMVETHLLDYKGDLYGREIRVEFVQKLRDEQRFPSSEQLKIQIEKDVRKVEALLAKDSK
ncbi:MAG: bifunctional riboflavin kinase/FAD synthetase [Dehalococcoidia bacterium]|nr:bifunctional riboflavin kinase/FAD synthetase [Dehalococcoidia bacterium]MDH4367001.1 bifunctional riboflavin kinase/FAD synthetase [Dehalococcoidia bacterium]